MCRGRYLYSRYIWGQIVIKYKGNSKEGEQEYTLRYVQVYIKDTICRFTTVFSFILGSQKTLSQLNAIIINRVESLCTQFSF